MSARPAGEQPAGRRPLAGRRYRPRTSPECTAKRHGNAAAYTTYHCRCAEAREDWRIYNKRRRHGRHQPVVIDGTGTRRRLQALATIGWTASLLANRLDVDPAGVTRLYHATRVNTGTAAAVHRLYTTLSDTPGPSTIAQRRAASNGWAPPIAWDDDTINDPTTQPAHQQRPRRVGHDVDEVAVARVLRGERLPLNPAERVAVAAVVLDQGRGASAVGTLLGCSGSAARGLLAHAAARRAAA